MQKDQKNFRSHGELNPALPIQSQVSLPSNHQLMKIASKYGKFEKDCEPGCLILIFFKFAIMKQKNNVVQTKKSLQRKLSKSF